MISKAAIFLQSLLNTSLQLTYSYKIVKGNSEIIELNVILITDERHKSKQYMGRTPS